MSKKKTTSLLSTAQRERHRVAATVTQETQWPQSEPNQGLARMFVIMLVVHIVVIGGIIIYDFVGEPAEAKSATVSTKTSGPKSSSTAALAAAPLPIIKDTPAPIAAKPAPAPETPVVAATPHEAPAREVTPPVIAKTETLPAVRVEVPAPVETVRETPSTMSIVTLPPAPVPTVEERPAQVKAAPPEKHEVTKKPVVNEEARRAEMIGNSQPKPVPQPSVARKNLEADKRTAEAATPKKKVTEDAPPAPKKKPAEVAAAKKAPVAKGTVRHTIGKNDTLYSLARKYKTTPDAILKANNLKDPNVLQDGKVLLIPSNK